jgi:hypothetical protein
VDVELIAYDGKNFKFASSKVVILKYDRYKPLTKLEAFPFEYHKDQKAIRTTLLERGKKYTTLFGIHHCTYNGFAEMANLYGRGSQYLMVRSTAEA